MRSTIQWDSFKDGWPNIFIQDVHEVAGRDGKIKIIPLYLFYDARFFPPAVIVIVSFHSPSVVFEQLSLIYSFPR